MSKFKPRIAVFPGSFDPITLGHVDVVQRSLSLFDRVIVAIGYNSQKRSLYDLDRRKAWIRDVFNKHDQVEVDAYEGLTINYCTSRNAQFILRGIRSTADFEYEKTIAHLNSTMQPEIETVLLVAKPELSSVSSTIVREIIKGKGDVSKFIPKKIADEISAI